MRATSKYTEGIGERIRTFRRRKKMNQVELGEKLGLSRQMISGYENERLLPPTYMIEKISDLFEINPWWLLYGVGRPSSESGIAHNLSMENILRGTEEELTSTQQTLINYIKADKVAAERLAMELLDRGYEKRVERTSQ